MTFYSGNNTLPTSQRTIEFQAPNCHYREESDFNTHFKFLLSWVEIFSHLKENFYKMV